MNPFNPDKANLNEISNEPAFISVIIQETNVECEQDGFNLIPLLKAKEEILVKKSNINQRDLKKSTVCLHNSKCN